MLVESSTRASGAGASGATGAITIAIVTLL
jgi:hypothetical protein